VSEQTSATGSIYDLGYQRYEGPQLGRPYAVLSLYLYSLRAIFGLGRSAWSKVFAFGLAGIALTPAVIQLAIAAVSPIDFQLVTPADHFGYVQVVVALFCALAAPEIVGRDQRNHTLPLYFSHALTRADYVLAKLAALATALFVILLLPLLLLVLGIAVADADVLGNLEDNIDQWPPILGSSLIGAAFLASISLAIAAHASRRAISTGAVFAYFVIGTTVGNVLVQTISGDATTYAILVSPLDVVDGTVRWLFGAPSIEGSSAEKAGLDGPYYLLATAAYTIAATAVLLRRFLRMTV
jgi:ABC-2 type transport system permease protein